MEEKELINGKPSLKFLPLFFIFLGLILLLITVATGWSWDDLANVMYIVSPIISLFGVFLYFYCGLCSITVTNKRVFGKVGFGNRVDLPFDMISAVGITLFTQGISVSTSSGLVKFMYMKNREEIHRIINNVLIERQGKTETVVKQEIPQSNADELKKYKDLLDSGVITQEEFDQKKKQLLGL